MENMNCNFVAPTCTNVPAEIAQNSTILEEGPRICPLCNAPVRLYYVHYTSKLFMCENIECEYPFGGDFTVYSSDDDDYFLSEFDSASFKRKRGSTATQSMTQTITGTSTVGTNSELSTSEWSDINRLNQAYDSDESTTLSKIFTRKSNKRKTDRKAKKQENEQKIKENVEKIKELNKVLFENEDDDIEIIRNEKWIKNLSTMQSSTGAKLVKEQELLKLKRLEQKRVQELKIDIEASTDSMSCIKIEIGGLGTNSKT
ncbi:uncharacterized protein LOC118276180 [Spodoptera frugiperda]|uniref:Uncharacterized protein LOC118276180 n=1 Tax=Spodoptera frugiperda TaxID=7108 RepID=A0A9R0EPP6_SPOFR|nr:uncharacterized protein LOC118276180 [Spodoptera frugiperda]